MAHVDRILQALEFRKILLESLEGLGEKELEEKLKQKIRELEDKQNEKNNIARHNT
jgi:hypothetical protein